MGFRSGERVKLSVAKLLSCRCWFGSTHLRPFGGGKGTEVFFGAACSFSLAMALRVWVPTDKETKRYVGWFFYF